MDDVVLTTTRPDLSYATKQLSQFMSDPKDIHLQAAHTVLCYIKSLVGAGIFFLLSLIYILDVLLIQIIGPVALILTDLSLIRCVLGFFSYSLEGQWEPWQNIIMP